MRYRVGREREDAECCNSNRRHMCRIMERLEAIHAFDLA